MTPDARSKCLATRRRLHPLRTRNAGQRSRSGTGGRATKLFEEKMPRLIAELCAQFAESAKLEQAIKANRRGLGYGG